MLPETILICTVGGSHQPIVTAIRELTPNYVCFICSGRDPETGRPGSDTQILGKGNIIKGHPADPTPSLPNIPVQVRLPEGSFRVEIVPTDDLDQVYAVCMRVFAELRQQFPAARRVADYTGGTKTMTAGLTVAALDAGVDLYLVTGNRGDLLKVRDGSQFLASANVEGVRLQRDMDVCLRAWQQYGYAEAAAALEGLPVPRSSAGRSRLFRARELSQAFAAWDRFDHVAALGRFQAYAPTLNPEERVLIGVLQRLLDPKDEPKRTAALILDLYRNAERRAAQGRYDDAVGRVYRMIEWTAQWLLKRDFGIDTVDIPAEFDAGGVELTVSRDGKRQAALNAAWTIVERRATGPAAGFIKKERDRLLDHLQRRNGSILAHGFKPVPASDWVALSEWLGSAFVPMLLDEARAVGIRELPPPVTDNLPSGQAGRMMSPDTHVCLVSEQPTPNITPVLDPAVAPRRVILIVSPDMLQRADWLESVLRPRGLAVERWTIDDAWDVEHIQARVLELLDREELGSLVLNATGGTKPMSIAAYREFRDADAPIFYVHPREDRLIWLHPKGRESIALADRIRLEPFLMAHGATVSGGIDRSLPDRELLEVAAELVRDIATLGGPLRALNWLAGQAEHARLMSRDAVPGHRRDVSALAERFAAVGLLAIDDGRLRFPNETARFFVNGGWLELYAYDAMRRVHAKTRAIQDLGRGLRVDRLIRGKAVQNELDVALLSDNRLYLIECKTRSWLSEHDEGPGAEALYKLDSLADRLGGLQTRTLLLSFQDLPDKDRRRAGELKIAVCAGQELLRLQEFLMRWLGVPP